MITLERPPQTVTDKALADWLFKVYTILSTMQLPVQSDATRGSPGLEGRIIFNDDDGLINLDDGTQWTLADGTPT